MVDLEYGHKFWNLKYKNIIKYYKRFDKHKRGISISFMIISIALIVKLGFFNIDSIIKSNSILTLEETTYTPFSLGNLNKELVKNSENYIIKDSSVNRHLQSINLEFIKDEVQFFLKETNNICIHLKQFGVKYDILVFNNITIINPEIISEGENIKNVPQINLNGEKIWAKRKTKVRLKYFNEKLNLVYDDLYNEQAFCFFYYVL